MDSSHGIKVKIGTAEIGKLLNITPPKSKIAIKNATTHESNGVEESVGGILSYDSVSIAFGFDKTDTTGQLALATAQANKTATAFTIEFPQGSTWAFNALVEEFQPIDGGEVDGLLTGNALLKITGAATFTAAP